MPGVKMADFLRHAATNVRVRNARRARNSCPCDDSARNCTAEDGQLHIDPEFARRYVNEGFSGGEMKRAEILQMAMLRPKFAIFDETDSGLDVDAVRRPARASPKSAATRWASSIITHHEQLLEHNQPDFTHVMLGGRIVETGGPELAMELHKQGYDRIRAAHPDAAAEEAAMTQLAEDNGRGLCVIA